MKQVIDWFEIPVSDMLRAQAFYEAVLQTTLHRENFGGPIWTWRCLKKKVFEPRVL